MHRWGGGVKDYDSIDLPSNIVYWRLNNKYNPYLHIYNTYIYWDYKYILKTFNMDYVKIYLDKSNLFIQRSPARSLTYALPQLDISGCQ